MPFKYTEAEFEDIKAMYTAGVSIEDIQAKHSSKSVASIRMKLVKAGIYNAVKKTTEKVEVGIKTVKKAAPTTKSGIMAAYKNALALCGEAIF